MAHRLSSASSALNNLIQKSKKLSSGPPERFCLLATRSNLDKDGKIRKWTFGQKHGNMENKTVLMVGETGTGKTTLINSMVNYYLGVKFEDKVWFEITEEDKEDQTESQTSEVTAYEIISEEKPFYLTIIDTPGHEIKKITQNLLKLFLHDTGVKDLDAVCLVLKASQNRISEAQRYIFEGVLSLFDKDIEDNIVLFITHSDGGAPTNALETVKKEKIPCCKGNGNEPVHFIFNNRQSEKTAEKYQDLSKAFWEMGERSSEEFFEFLHSREWKSVGLAFSVLIRRVHLKAFVQSLKKRIQYREEKKEELTQVQDALNEHKEMIEKDEKVPFTVKTVYKEKVDITGALWWDQNVTSCKTCEENCHEFDCWAARSAWWCHVMKDDYCSVCLCHYSKHVRESRKYVTKKKEEKVTLEDLEKKYSNKKSITAFNDMAEEQSKMLKQKQENLESDLKKLLGKNDIEKKRLVKEAYKAIIKLSVTNDSKVFAFTLQYLDFLIPRVEEAGEPEWAQKLKKMQTRG